MEIRLDQVEETFEWRETLRLSRGELDRPEVLELDEVDFRGRLCPTVGGYLLKVSLSYLETLRCVRCLEPLARPMASEVELLIVPRGTEEEEEERELSEDDFGILHLESPVLDTRPLVVEQVQLGVPMKPLCREDCAGLCSSCGADLNLGRCDCAAAADPRWAALAGHKLRGGR